MDDEANIRGGFNGQLRRGKRPALLVIDFQRGFTESDVSPLAADCTAAVESTNRLIDAMRGLGQVLFTVVGYDANFRDMGIFGQKCSALVTLQRGTKACELDPRLKYDASCDLIVAKTQASAFFGTPLCGILASAGCDMLIITGATTSGCVRASAVDAMQYGFPPFVVREAVADRSAAQHQSNLIDMQSKYADVVDLESMVQDLEALRR